MLEHAASHQPIAIFLVRLFGGRLVRKCKDVRARVLVAVELKALAGLDVRIGALAITPLEVKAKNVARATEWDPMTFEEYAGDQDGDDRRAKRDLLLPRVTSRDREFPQCIRGSSEANVAAVLLALCT